MTVIGQPAPAWSGVAFKRENPWLAQVNTLPFTRIYRAGQPWKEFAGGGVDRLRRRLDGLPAA